MSGTTIISDDDASHAKECAKYLAELAVKYLKMKTDKRVCDGDELDVQNNLNDVIAVLSGEQPKKGG